MVLSVETVGEIVNYDQDGFEASERLPIGSHLVKGVISDQDGLILIYDIGSSLTEDEEETLAAAINEAS